MCKDKQAGRRGKLFEKSFPRTPFKNFLGTGLVLGVLLVGGLGRADTEADYRDAFARVLGLRVTKPGVPGDTEVYCAVDRTRVDVLHPVYAIEVDYAREKWAEGVGQALRYARNKGRIPGILYILRAPEDMIYVERVKADVMHWDIPVRIWTVNADRTEYTSWEHKRGDDP